MIREQQRWYGHAQNKWACFKCEPPTSRTCARQKRSSDRGRQLQSWVIKFRRHKRQNISLHLVLMQACKSRNKEINRRLSVVVWFHERELTHKIKKLLKKNEQKFTEVSQYSSWRRRRRRAKRRSTNTDPNTGSPNGSVNAWPRPKGKNRARRRWTRTRRNCGISSRIPLRRWRNFIKVCGQRKRPHQRPTDFQQLA